MGSLETWELLSYVVTVVGLPFAILVFLFEKRKERANEDEEIYQQLSDEYADFIKLVLEHADLRLRSHEPVELSAEQQERKLLIFDLLISLFERAYLSVYEDDMGKQQRRMWQSWEDYMREWCSRADFRAALPGLLKGEDEDFAAHLRRVADEEAQRRQPAA
jgi:hypothetical protein